MYWKDLKESGEVADKNFKTDHNTVKQFLVSFKTV